ncbi:MAG: HAMP domain-containing sensor histidine kinase [Actinomycetota bacterium]
MKLRTRLVIAIGYILLAVIVALTIPLAVTLAGRAKSDLEARTLLDAQTIAGYIGAENLTQPRALARIIEDTTPAAIERVVVVDVNGIVLLDSAGTATGEDFTNGERPEIDTALTGLPTAEERFSETEGANIMVAAAPIIDETIVGALRLTRDYGEVDAAIGRTIRGLIVIGAAGVLAGVLIAFALAGSLAGPTQRLASTARRLGAGDLSARAGDIGGAAEVVDLARAFDEMAARLERTVRAQQEFVANASHQLRTPLAGMKLRLEGAIDASEEGSDVRRQAEAADREVDRLAAIVTGLLETANRMEQGRGATEDLREAANRTLERWHERAMSAGAALSVSGDPAFVEADRTDLDQILDVVLDNAIAYAPGPISVTTAADARSATIRIRDDGPGIPAAEQERVTERFYRGSSATAGGSGLGLAIAKQLAERWSGSLELTSDGPRGTAVVVSFPRVTPDP